ncbi:hypothetical protein, partial [Acinetobacter pittii]|uniref:hypothetical protein n=1 Tax=Acinetobacter pittii TaxID=48296 RepID=UPI003009A8A0
MFSPCCTLVLAAAEAAFNWSTFAASVPSTPAATFLIALLPASIPLAVTLGPLAIVKPSLFRTLLPAVTLFRVRSLFRLYLMLFPSFATARLVSPSAV